MIGFDPGEQIVCSGPDPTLPEAQWPSSRQFKKKNKHHRQRGHLHDYFARRDAEAMDQHHSTLTSCHTDLCHLQAADSQFSESFRNEAREKFNKAESAIRKVRANAYEGFDVDRAAVLRAIQKNREKEEHCQLELIRKKMNEKKQQLERHETEIRKELEGHQSRLDHLEDDVLQAGMKNVLELGNDIQAQYDQRIRTLHTVLGKLVEETESRMDHERAQRIRAFHAVEALRSEKKGSGISTII